MKPTYWKMEIMAWESSDVKFDIGPFLQGQTRISKLKSAYSSLIIDPRVVLLTVYLYVEYRFVLVEKTKSTKNIWEPVFEDVIILGFLMCDTSSKRQKIYK